MHSMNGFDIAVYVVAVMGIITGFRSGLLRSVATIVAYITAMPLAVAATPYVARLVTTGPVVSVAAVPGVPDSGLFFAVFLGFGIALSAVLRAVVGEMVGGEINILDRLGGAILGGLRVVLVAVTLVLIFDRVIPGDRQPAFLAGSQLRPLLLAAGKAGLKSLPSDVTAFIDQLKNARHI